MNTMEECLEVKCTYRPIRGGKLRCIQTGKIISRKLAKSYRLTTVNDGLMKILLGKYLSKPKKNETPPISLEIINGIATCPQGSERFYLDLAEEDSCPKCGRAVMGFVKKEAEPDIKKEEEPKKLVAYLREDVYGPYVECPKCEGTIDEPPLGEATCFFCGTKFEVV